MQTPLSLMQTPSAAVLHLQCLASTHVAPLRLQQLFTAWPTLRAQQHLSLCTMACHAPLQHLFSFDEAHPGIASQHYKRSNKQDAELQQERQQLEVQRRKWVHETCARVCVRANVCASVCASV